MRRILEGSKGCITRTGEHQIDELRTVDYDKKEASCIICGDILVVKTRTKRRKDKPWPK